MHPKGSLAKGSWHGVAVTEGFTVGTSNSHKSNVETQQPIAPSGRELSPQVTEGASGRCGCGLLMGLYLLIITDSLCQFYRMLSYDRSQKPDRPGEVPPPTVQSPLRPLAPSVLGLRPKPPPSGREV